MFRKRQPGTALAAGRQYMKIVKKLLISEKNLINEKSRSTVPYSTRSLENIKSRRRKDFMFFLLWLLSTVINFLWSFYSP